MKRMGLLVAVLLLGLVGCSKAAPPGPPSPAPAGGSPTASGPPSASATPSASASSSPGDAVEFSVDGAGRYQLGLTRTALAAQPGLDAGAPAPGCPQNTVAHGTGIWAAV